MKSLSLLFVLTFAVLLYTHVGNAQVMTSSNYRIQSDSVNMGGGFSSSTTYVLESTVGEIATGPSDSDSYLMRAGYQQMHEVYLALSSATDVTMAPSIPGVTGGTANGSTTVTAITDSTSGYQLTIQSSDTPSMQSGVNTIADYTPGGDPDYTFTTGAADSHFGYSPFGDDITQAFRDNGNACNAGSNNTAEACWDGLSTTPAIIAESVSANNPLGTDTTVYFRVGVGSSVLQAPGIYTATTTLTLLAR